MKDTMDNLADTIKNTVDNVRDGVRETGHRANARLEEERRATAGDEMTLGEKMQSAFKQGKEELQADYDRTKREVRTDNG
ncbi:MAG: hypothetical protein NVS1B14_03470 [Vulcanimicrobiaceae bacterium]